MSKRYKILSFKAVGTVVPHSLEDIHQALALMGHRVYVLDLPQLNKRHHRLPEIATLDALLDIKPDIVLTIDTVGLVAQQYPLLDESLKVVSWFFDAPPAYLEELDMRLLASRYFLYCWDKVYEQESLQRGVGFFSYLAFGTNPLVYREITCAKKYDVSFVGSWSEKRQSILQKLGEKGIKIALFGNKKWGDTSLKNVCYHGFADNRSECPQIYNSSRINLNISNEQLKTSLPVRIFDVGACGGFILTDKQQDAIDIFGDDLRTYTDVGDLEEKIHFYLKEEADRNLLAKKFQKRILEGFTFEKRLQILLDSLVVAKVPFAQLNLDEDELVSSTWKHVLGLVSLRRVEEAQELVNLILRRFSQNSKLRLAYYICCKFKNDEHSAKEILKSTPSIVNLCKSLSFDDMATFRSQIYDLPPDCFAKDGSIMDGKAQRAF